MTQQETKPRQSCRSGLSERKRRQALKALAALEAYILGKRFGRQLSVLLDLLQPMKAALGPSAERRAR